MSACRLPSSASRIVPHRNHVGRRFVVVDPPTRALSWYASERDGESGRRQKGSIRLVGATIQREVRRAAQAGTVQLALPTHTAPPPPQKGNSFRVLTEGRALIARADSESDAEQWVAAIRGVISGAT